MLNRKLLRVKKLKSRVHDLEISAILPLKVIETSMEKAIFSEIANRIVNSKSEKAAVIIMCGGHVVRSGVQRFLIDLMDRGYVSCLAMNGAGLIHDYEFALIGATTESVSHYIKEGKFGLWEETGKINDIINTAFKKDRGMGEAVGKYILSHQKMFPHADLSLLAAGERLSVPVTVHVGIGYDIIHEHPNCDGAATGATSYRDFLKFAGIVENLEGGMVMNFGSAVMAPEVYLKALSMARNIAHQKNRSIRHFSTLVCDLHSLPADLSKEPPKDSAAYFFRPFKTMLVRTVADGGKSFYVKGYHSETIPALWSAINQAEKK